MEEEEEEVVVVGGGPLIETMFSAVQCFVLSRRLGESFKFTRT